MGGLAVDVTDAYRNQTMLQSTADASALAGVMSLPDQNDALAQALTYATDNMNPAINGNVLDADEVIFGNWDFDNRIFTPGTAAPDAVRVITRRDDANNNALATNFLRILSLWGIPLDRWNISVEAVAVRYVPGCLRDGFIARSTINMGSGNDFYNEICIHGQDDGVAMRIGNYFDPGVQVSMSDIDDLFVPDMDRNENLSKALVEGDLWPKDVDYVGDIVAGMKNLDPNYLPEFMVDVAEGTGVRTTDLNVQMESLTSLPATFQENTVYVIDCKGQIDLPGTLISNVVIAANCRIHSNAGLTLEDVVLATSYAGNNAAISIAAQSTLGKPDDCKKGGGVEFYTPGDVHIAALGDWHGLRIVSGNNVKFTSKNVGIHGMSVQAKNTIDMSSQNDFGLCEGGVPGQFVAHYRLVR